MLSFLYRLVRAYHREHGYSPNVVMMNREHFRILTESLPELADYTTLVRFLRMEIILSEDCVHPHVAWRPQAERAARG